MTFGVKSVSKSRKPVENKNAEAAMIKARIPPPNSLIIFAITKSEAAPSKAGINRIPKTEYPKILFTMNARNPITGGTVA
jgi:hypothetical protein